MKILRIVLANNGTPQRTATILKKAGLKLLAGGNKFFWASKTFCSPRDSFSKVYGLKCASGGYIVAFVGEPAEHCAEIWSIDAAEELKSLSRLLGCDMTNLEVVFRRR